MKPNLMLTLCAVSLGLMTTAAYASQCIECHTSPRQLIQITREIAKSRPIKQVKSKGLG